jgi:hypothetical protein
MRGDEVFLPGESTKLSETPNFDIVGAWRNFLGKWETAGNSLGGQAMGTPDFSTAINQAGNLSTAVQHFFAEMSAKYAQP